MRHSPCVSLLLLLLPAVGAGQTREGFLERPHGVQLYYRVEGQGSDTLVYLHGGPGGTLSDGAIEENQSLFQRHTVIFYQQRGNGRSSPGTEDSLISAAQHVEDLEALRKAFHLDPVILYGVSWGGGLAALYAAQYPEHVARLIQVNPMPPRRTDPSAPSLALARLDTTEQRLFNEAAHRYGESPDTTTCRAFMRLSAQIYTVPGPNREAMIAKQCRDPHRLSAEERHQQSLGSLVFRRTLQSLGDWNLTAALHQVKAPALIVHGDADFLPFSSVQEYVQAYPTARYLIVADAGHALPGDNPQPFFAALEAFLDGQWPAGSRSANE